MSNLSVVLGLSVALAVVSALSADPPEKAPANQTTKSPAETELAALVAQYEAKYKPLLLKNEQAWWEANITGSDEAFKKKEAAAKALVELHCDRDVFAKLKRIKEQGGVTDPLLARHLQVMCLAYLPGQADKDLQRKIVELETKVEQVFNTFRGEVNGKQLTENEIRDILSSEKDSALAEKAWKAYMAAGAKVAPMLPELVGLRNQLARQLGFRDYFAMQVSQQEIDEKELWRIFDELQSQTEEPYAALKKEIDTAMAARFGMAAGELRPWHFGDLFFQEPPSPPEDKLSRVYTDKDMLALARTYYESLGLPVDDIIARSDLYEKPGKCPHAFAADLDRAGDIRVLANLKPNLYWMDTLLHELGHAVYDKYIPQEVPFVLRTASHGITTEGIALMMGGMSKNEDWLVKAVKLPPDQAAEACRSARGALRSEKLVFCRWAQVVVRFERAMYEKPDQDLGKLWWDLKRQYQLLNPPEDVTRPDYAAKIHIVTVPVYYHNYVLGDLFAAQVQHHIASAVLPKDLPGNSSFYGRKEVGVYLRDRIFAPGSLVSWNELTKQATGEPLSAKCFVRQFVQEPAK
jgi:peptidyl-dipeptidase A